ncbi:hypothetical protein [Microbacterium dextranolyticum]|nr:hypothetical protein [Microbacterium dextranolyticum]MBM7464137.1 hypothetical protein [Microbacterium dextranolyticum]
MIRRAAPVAALACALALTLGLSACVPESARPQTSASATPTGTSGAVGVTPSPDASAPSVPSTPAPGATPTGPAVDPAACLAGTWTMDQAALERFFTDVNTAMAGTGATFAPTGSATLTLTPTGGFTWSPAASIDAAVAGTTVLISVGGSAQGVFTATSDRISTGSTSTDGLTVTATINGSATDPGPIARQIVEPPVTDASYTCTSDTLTLVSAISGGTATSVLHR